jgi:hypothetical protein
MNCGEHPWKKERMDPLGLASVLGLWKKSNRCLSISWAKGRKLLKNVIVVTIPMAISEYPMPEIDDMEAERVS